MAKIRVTEAFSFTAPDGTIQHFTPGMREIDDKFADHWYVAAHCREDDDSSTDALDETPSDERMGVRPPPSAELTLSKSARRAAEEEARKAKAAQFVGAAK